VKSSIINLEGNVFTKINTNTFENLLVPTIEEVWSQIKIEVTNLDVQISKMTIDLQGTTLETKKE